MALNKSVNQYGVDFAEAYIVITRVEYDKGLNHPTDPSTRDYNSFYDILIYPNQSARDSNAQPLKNRRIYFNLDTQSDLSAIKQAYANLKSLEEYSEAVDI